MHAGRAVAVVVVAGVVVSAILGLLGAPDWMVWTISVIGVLVAARYVRVAVRRDVGGD
jgi:hypothetical protein